jgi:hypothetical protein
MKKRGREAGAKSEARNMGIEVLETIRKRLRRYATDNDLKIKVVVNEAIDEYLKKRGA